MAKNLLTEIADSIKAANPFFLEGYTNTRRFEGKVMAGDGRERSYKGIDDRNGNYFYIRLNDETELQYSEADVQFTSCDDTYDIILPLRLVSVTRGMDLFAVEKKLRNDMLRIAWVGDDYQSGMKINLESATLDPINVYQQETGKEDMKGNVGLLAIDFSLEYRYINNNCLTVQDLCDDLLC